MSDGTTKPIEQVKVGDTVLSKNEKTGEIAPKRVSHVSVRAAIWTRKLTFDGGVVLETTDEHPLYIEGSGFAKAKEVGIGSSIVTRAGPSAKVVAVEADVRQATVYNFTVDEFHTYFVGDAALWVHNADTCPLKIDLPNFVEHQIKGKVPEVRTDLGGARVVPRNGVDGSHSEVEFIKNYMDPGLVRIKPNSRVDSGVDGIYTVSYEIPRRNVQGEFINELNEVIPGISRTANPLSDPRITWRTPDQGGVQTLYDPSKVSDSLYSGRIIQARIDAGAKGTTNLRGGRAWEGTDSTGMKWTGFDGADGNLVTGFPQ